MRFKVWKLSRKIEIGVKLYPNGSEVPFAHDGDFVSAFDVPVIWKGERAVMHFHSGSRTLPTNSIATQMLNHSGLFISGQVEIITHVDFRYKMRIWAQEEYVRDAIANLQFDTPPIFGRSRYSEVDVYTKDRSDLVAIRMCI